MITLRPDVPSVTDAQPSADDDLRSRRRRYTVLMALHLAGLAVGGMLYQQAWTLGLIILIATGPLQWVAVILANDSRRRSRRGPQRPDPSTPQSTVVGPATAAHTAVGVDLRTPRTWTGESRSGYRLIARVDVPPPGGTVGPGLSSGFTPKMPLSTFSCHP